MGKSLGILQMNCKNSQKLLVSLLKNNRKSIKMLVLQNFQNLQIVRLKKLIQMIQWIIRCVIVVAKVMLKSKCFYVITATILTILSVSYPPWKTFQKGIGVVQNVLQQELVKKSQKQAQKD